MDNLEILVVDNKRPCLYGVCWPLIVYLIITIIALIIIMAIPNLDASSKATTLLITLAWAVFWGFILWLLCTYCGHVWAWILMFIPFILNLLFFIIVLLAVGAFDTSGSFPSSLSIIEASE